MSQSQCPDRAALVARLLSRQGPIHGRFRSGRSVERPKPVAGTTGFERTIFVVRVWKTTPRRRQRRCQPITGRGYAHSSSCRIDRWGIGSSQTVPGAAHWQLGARRVACAAMRGGAGKRALATRCASSCAASTATRSRSIPARMFRTAGPRSRRCGATGRSLITPRGRGRCSRPRWTRKTATYGQPTARRRSRAGDARSSVGLNGSRNCWGFVPRIPPRSLGLSTSQHSTFEMPGEPSTRRDVLESVVGSSCVCSARFLFVRAFSMRC